MEAKPKVWVVIFIGIERDRWPCPKLLLNCVTMARDERFDVEIDIINKQPLPHARNVLMQRARDIKKPDWLCMVDNDQAYDGNPLDCLALALDKPVLSIPSLMSGTVEDQEHGQLVRPNSSTVVLKTEQGGKLGLVERVAGGITFINKIVWEKIPKGPWFKFNFANDELDTVTLTEDYYFSDLLREHGIENWVVNKVASHYHTVDLLYIAKHIKI